MVSSKIVELALLARERLLPTCFERAWIARTGTNPVLLAINVVETDEKKKLCKEKVLSTLVQAILYGVASVALFLAASLSLSNAYTSFFGVLAFFFVCTAFIFLRKCVSASGTPTRSFGLGAEREILAFYADLEDFRDWGSITAILLRVPDEAFKNIAETIMVRAARMQLECQAATSENPEEETRILLNRSEATAEFHRRYSALHRLGLVSGDYDKYYDKAKRQMNEKKSAA